MMPYLFRTTLLIILLLGLGACQTRLKIAGTKHQKVAAKWHGLAQYAESKIVNYGVTITANLVIEAIDDKPAFTLQNIKFSEHENVQNINLLTPSFEHKYICLPLCFQLLEYVAFDGVDSATLLDSFFSEHEFELFQFYGDLVILSERLDTLANRDNGLLRAYLLSLTRKKESFGSTKEFIAYWDNSLALGMFEQFMRNPVDIDSDFLQDYRQTPDRRWRRTGTNANNNSQYGENTYNENDDILPNEHWLASSQPTPESSAFQFLEGQVEEVLNWEDGRQLAIVIGENVCSYENNLFGVVTNDNGNQVEVNVLGQAKTFKDGVVQDVASGSLFNSISSLYFIPMQEMQSFAKADVATCYIE
ncbi:hypothetical protein [Paraglaciecola hydrolytica]|uniref:Uncharacterized protein n=1 Tax=Paraglaciecola hydrolytica TaxID=1799789 RepID=A0A148KN01_9ALTE|nr:hypothetical protein [Paraglaciecola hydrolytica]KXI27661.1 hypothetical protein AX660_19075 [Paraglaciecola hydrolytica]